MPLSAADHLAVIDLIASYALRIDSGDIDGFVDNFLPDAVFETAAGESVGHDQIRAWAEARKKRVGGAQAEGRHEVRHFTGIPLISGDGDRCQASTYCVITDYGDDKRVRVPLVGTYEDACVKVDGRWRFARRKIVADLQIPGR